MKIQRREDRRVIIENVERGEVHVRDCWSPCYVNVSTKELYNDFDWEEVPEPQEVDITGQVDIDSSHDLMLHHNAKHLASLHSDYRWRMEGVYVIPEEIKTFSIGNYANVPRRELEEMLKPYETQRLKIVKVEHER
jgi:hypothetical protein